MSDNNKMISDEAVEAAAKCHYEVLHRLKVWEDLAPAERLLARDMMRIALEAAAPHIIAGYIWETNLKAIAYELETPLLFKKDLDTPNPYRSQA